MAVWAISREVKLGDQVVVVTANKETLPDHRTVVLIAGKVGPVEYSERWPLPRNNHTYSQEQAQKDFDASIEKVAKETLGRFVSRTVAEGLK